VDRDTEIGGPGGRFPATQHSVLDGAQSDDPAERRRAWDVLVAAYWKPAYKYIRLKWRCSNEEAKDLTQGFFTRAVEKDFFRSYDPEKGSFRNFLRVCLDGFVANERQSAQRIKRGGEFQITALEFETAEGELRQVEVADPFSMEEYFHQEWVRSVFSLALERFRQKCEAKGKQLHFRIFQAYDLGDGARLTYQDMAREFGISVTDVTNYLHYARTEFRGTVLDTLRELTATNREFQEDARFLLRGER
jgi:RNA polymerase sigma factor (sigma-70 family)